MVMRIWRLQLTTFITVGYEFDATDNYATDFDALGGASIVLDDGYNAVTIDVTDAGNLSAALAFAAGDTVIGRRHERKFGCFSSS